MRPGPAPAGGAGRLWSTHPVQRRYLVTLEHEDLWVIDARAVLAAFEEVAGPTRAPIGASLRVETDRWGCTITADRVPCPLGLVFEFDGRAPATYLDRLVESVVRRLEEGDGEALDWATSTGSSVRAFDIDGVPASPALEPRS